MKFLKLALLTSIIALASVSYASSGKCGCAGDKAKCGCSVKCDCKTCDKK